MYVYINCVSIYVCVCICIGTCEHTHACAHAHTHMVGEEPLQQKYGKEQNQLSMSYYPAQKAITNKYKILTQYLQLWNFWRNNSTENEPINLYMDHMKLKSSV